jgi:nicotinamidase-related amidase
MVNDYFRDGPLHDQRAALTKSINQLASCFRENGLPIIWVRQEFSPNLSDAFPEMRRSRIRVTIAGTQGANILEELKRSPKDHEIIKKRYSAFFQTQLDNLLHENDWNPIILAGVNTHACIRMTAIDAYQRDLEVIVAEDCIGSYDTEHHRITLNYLEGKIAEVLTNAEIRKQLST